MVCGPHRSGTSAITKGLEVLGVSLGSALMPPDSSNEKGYWEDLDFYALNREMLASTGRDWHHLKPLDEREITSLQEKYFQRASRLLKEKSGSTELLGVKDPRFSLLLAFWKNVFEGSGFEASYVVAVRHPLSVAASLAAVHRLPEEKASWLWISHMLGCLVGTEKCGRITVDFDTLLRDPAIQIGRLANALRLEVREDRLRDFQESFLDASLNHAPLGDERPSPGPACCPLAEDIYQTLHRISTDRAAFSGPDYEYALAKWLESFSAAESLLALSQKNDLALNALHAVAEERMQSILELQAALSERDRRMELLGGEKDQLLRDLEAQAAKEKELRATMRRLKIDAVERQRDIESFQESNSEMQSALDSVEIWQRSWRRRAFTRWHRVRSDDKAGLPRRLERSIRKWRKKLLRVFKRKDRGSGSSSAEPAIRGESRNPLVAGNVNRSHRTGLLSTKSFLIVAELSIPQCLRYRVNQKAEVLESMGYSAKVVSWADWRGGLSALPTCGSVIFYRTPAVKEVVFLTQEARRLGLTTFFEIDDLVFDVAEYRRNSNVLSLEKSEQMELLRGADLYREMLRHVDHAIGSTELITRRLDALVAGRSFTVENALDSALLDAAERQFPRAASSLTTIAYGSGTKTHDADFALVAGPLARVMAEHPSVRLLLAGPLQIPESLGRFGERILRIPLLGFAEYLAALARCDINLAPLQPGLFNDAKSNIKFLEASVLGLPSVCSPRAEFKNAIRDGDNGFLAEGEDEWHRKLAALVVDPDLRRSMGARARADVLASHHPETRTRQQLVPVLDAAFPAMETAGGRTGTPLKILVANVHFAPDSFGGATCVAEQLSAELARLPQTGVAVFAGTHDPETAPNSLQCYEWDKIPVFAARLPTGGTARDDYENPAMARLFEEVLDCVRPDIVHFHSIQMLSAKLARVCQERRVPYVITLHDAWWICERQFMVTGAGHYCHQAGVDPLKCVGCTANAGFSMKRFNHLWEILSGAAHLLAPSAFFRDLYIQTGVDPGLISVNKNGVMRRGSTRHPARKEPSGNRVTFAFAGGRAVHKGYFWLREIFREIRESNFRLKIVDLERKFGGRSVFAKEWSTAGEVKIAEPYTQETIDDFYSGVDVLLFPSLWKESFGLTVREALLRDIWVISTDCGGPVEDLRDGVNSTIVPMGDTTAFREAIRSILLQPERLNSYSNPHKSEIRFFPEQALETREFLARAAESRIPPDDCHRASSGITGRFFQATTSW